MRTLLVFIALAHCSGLVNAQAVYKTVDEQGRVTYSDQPPADQKQQGEAKLPPLNALPEQRPERAGQPRPRAQREPEIPDYQIQVLRPAPQTSVPPGQRDLNIVAGLDQKLAPQHLLAFYLDGELLAQTRERQFLVQEIYRGSHTIHIEVVDADGRPLAQSEPVIVHVHRPSVINRPGS